MARWLFACGLLSWATLVHAADPRAFASTLREDASLLDVTFVDPRLGWAVGYHGTIWHTGDGGQTWSRQESGTTAPLHSVAFLDARHGWAVGGHTTPLIHTRGAVVLRTSDGGQTWQHDRSVLLPALKRIQLLSPTHAWAWGDPSALFPTGLFTTDDGGRSWTPAVSELTGGFSAGDFVDPYTGAVASSLGGLESVRRRATEATPNNPLGMRRVRQLKLVGDTRGWLVGDGGLVMRSDDLGRTWQTPPGDLAALTGDECDWRAVAAVGSSVWVVGSPGSRVGHSSDDGRTWQWFETGASTPLNALTMLDEQRGWAVGELGWILATVDGGRSWRVQHRGGSRAALLALLAEPERVPFELLLRLCASEGYLAHVELLTRPDLERGAAASPTLDSRTQEAVTMCGAIGAESAWRFPARHAGLMLSAQQQLDAWDRANDGQSLQRLDAHLVRQIRQWRPEIIVTHAPSPRGSDPLGHLMSQLVLRAVEQAADPTRFPELSARWGLQPWQVKKVYGRLEDAQLGATNVTTSQLVPQWRGSLAELAELPRALVCDQPTPSPSSLGFQLLVNTLPQGSGRDDFFSGIALAPEGDARRRLLESNDDSLDLMRRLAQKQRNLQAIIAHSDRAPQDAPRLLAQLGELTQGLDSASAGDLLYQLALHYARSGRWELAADCLQIIVARHPNHPVSAAALMWLVQSNASSEILWRMKKPSTPLRESSTLADRAELSASFARQLEQLAPAVFAEPTVQFPLAVAQRARGYNKSAERYYLHTAQTRGGDAWRACATGEQWLLNPQSGPSPKAIGVARKSVEKPRLDGQLDEPFWQSAQPLELKSPLGDDPSWPAVALIAYDDEFLYLAARCQRPAPQEPPPQQAARPRDPDLSTHDRVEWLIDVDRDYATYYRLVIDHRGWVAEDCWGDTSWNPNWYVARGGDAERWSVEAAIPWSELVEHAPQARHAWAVGVQRTVPGTGFQSWTQPAAINERPEGFGFVLFE